LPVITLELHSLVYLPVSLVAWLLELRLLVFLQASLPVMTLELQSGVPPSVPGACCRSASCWSHKPV
jgi:hypothetical protein